MAQSRLETEAISKREELSTQLEYKNYGEYVNEYSADHKDALSDGDPQGKGTGVALGEASLPGANTSKAISYSNMVTTDGGGSYDIEGRNGVGGRDFLKTRSLYTSENSYGQNSVDTTINRETYGQFYVE